MSIFIRDEHKRHPWNDRAILMGVWQHELELCLATFCLCRSRST